MPPIAERRRDQPTFTHQIANKILLSITEIDWKPTMNLCMKETKKKQKSKAGKNKGQVRTVTQQEPKQSFFQYFSEPIEVTQRIATLCSDRLRRIRTQESVVSSFRESAKRALHCGTIPLYYHCLVHTYNPYLIIH